jgi:threonine/homoserine/homoserine lactone efflux protein
MGCLSLMFLLVGIANVVVSVIALNRGRTVTFGRYLSTIQVSPWFTLIFGGIFLAFGIAGIFRVLKDKDKYDF